MPQYEISVPGRGKYRVDSPEDLTDEQVWQAVQGQLPPPASTERTFGEAAKDIGAGVVSGIGALTQLPGQLYGLATGDLSETGTLGLGKKIQEYGQEMKSPGLKAREEQRAEKIKEAAERGQGAAFGTAFKETVSDLGLLTTFLAEQAPQLLVPFGAGRIGSAVARGAGATAEAAGAAGTRAAVGAGVVQQGADVGEGAYRKVYDELISKGATKEEAAEGAINLARGAGASGALISVLSNKLPGARKLEEVLAGVPGKGSRLGTGFKTAAGEIPSEITEEVGGRLSQNIALRDVKPEQSLTEGLGETGAMATIGAAGLGGAAGLLQGRAPAPPKAVAPEEPPVAPPVAPRPIAPKPPVPPALPAPEAQAGLPAPEVPTALPAPEAPVAEAPVEPPVEQPIPVAPELDDAARAALADYTSGLPSDAADVFERLQNRDRATPASIAQMKGIGAKPDYDRLKSSPDFSQGAPIVMSDIQLPATSMGRVDIATAADGRKIPVQYAVVSANDLLTSHTSDGQKNLGYADISLQGIRTVAGNGRVAGLQEAYGNKAATDYLNKMLSDNQHGISAESIKGIQNPVLVRVMPKAYVTKDIGDVSNISAGLGFNPVEKAKNDAARFDLNGLQFDEGKDGSIKLNDATAMQFIMAMPKTEQGELLDGKGRPNTMAMARLNNAIFYKAYKSDTLIDLFAQATDPEATLILRGMQKAAPKMFQIEGTGEYDVRQNLIDAAELAVNARRDGVKLKDYVKQGMIGVDPKTLAFLEMFADNSRSGTKMGELLSNFADAALKQSSAGADMFGNVPKIPVEELLKFPKPDEDTTAPPAPPAPPPPAPPAPPPPKPPVKPAAPPAKPPAPPVPPAAPKKPATPPATPPGTERKDFQIDKSKEQIAKEVKGMTIPELAQWAIDNAPNSVAKEIATKVLSRIQEFDKLNLFPDKILILNDGRRNTKGVRGAAGFAWSPSGYKISLRLNGTVNGVADGRSGTRYSTILHELTHVATHSQLGHGATSKEYNDLTVLLKKVRDQVKADVKNSVKHPILDSIARGSNTIKDVDELVAWGFTDANFQDYLSKIKVGNTNGFSKLVGIVRNLLGLSPSYETALDALMRTGETLLDEQITDLVQGLRSRGITFKGFAPVAAKGKRGTPEATGTESTEEVNTESSNFQKWFGDSKVVDKRGEPVVLYTGTSKDLDFKKFKIPKNGAWFTTDPSVASQYALENDSMTIKTDDYRTFEQVNTASRVIPVYVKIENPYTLTAEEASQMRSASNYKKVQGIIFERAKAKGYDGINLGDGIWVVIDSPTQIKSVFNKGEYSLVKGEILEESIGETAAKVVEKAKEKLQKRPPIDAGAMQGVDPGFIKDLGPVFNPQSDTIIDKIESMKDGFFRRAAQGIADQYRTIKDYSEEAYMQARISKSIDGALEGLLFNGHVFNDGGALNINTKEKGLFKALEPVGAETDRYMIWVALNREARLPLEKRSPNLAGLIGRRDQLSAGKIGNESRLEVYEKVLVDMNKLNKSVLRVALQNGLIDEDAYQKFSSDLFYIPFYKQMEDGDLEGAKTAAGLDRQQFSKALEGKSDKPFGDLMENTLRNWSHILSASMKNQAANTTIDAAMEMEAVVPNLKPQFTWIDGKVYSTNTGEMVGDGSLQFGQTKAGKGMIKVMRDGQPMYFEVFDPMLLDAITSIGYVGKNNKFVDVARDFKNLLQYGVTLSPAFKIGNLIRDSISALAVSGLRKNPIANVIEGINLSRKDDPNYIAALAGGAIFNFGSTYEGDQAALVKRLLKMGVQDGTILNTADKIKRGLSKSFDAYQDLGNKSEAANRMALYKQMRDQGKSHLEASYAARDLLDFSMQGSWPAFRFLTQVAPFLNARVQGLYKLGRDGVIPTGRVLYNTVTGKPIEQSDKMKAQAFSAVTSVVALASLALYFAFKDDEDFKKRDEWDRDNFWWFKLPGMDAAFRIPKPFEIGAFGTLVERTAEQIFDDSAEGRQIAESMKRMVVDTFAMNPMPQIFKPLVDLYANKDSFTGAPIESSGMERLSKQQRITDSTSPLAIAVGGISNLFLPEKTEMSPVQVEYAIKGYFGWLGASAAWLSHYAVMPFKDGTKPDNNWVDTMSVGFVKTLPANQSRYVTSFYDHSKEIGQAYADMRHYAEIGDAEKVQKILEEKGSEIQLAKFYDKTSKDMAEVRAAIRIITNDPEKDGAQKREEIDRLKQLLSMMAEQAESVRKSLKP